MMFLDRISNLPYSKILDDIEALVFDNGVVSINVVGLFLLRDDDWCCAMAKITLGGSQHDREDLCYPNIRIVSFSYQCDAKRSLTSGEIELFSGLRISLNKGSKILRSISPSTKEDVNPSIVYEIELQNKVSDKYFCEGPMISSVAPFYKNSDELIEDKFGIDFHGSQDGRLGDAMIYVKDISEKIQYEDGVASLISDNGRWLTGVSKEGKVHRSLMFREAFRCDVDRLSELYVVDRDGRVANAFHMERFLDGFGDKDAEIRRTLVSHLMKGEGENTEFKPFVNSSEKKFDEVVKTVVAFSNTSGGSIYMGVSDEAEIIGCRREAQKASKHCSNKTSAVGELSEWASSYIRKAIQEKVTETYCFDTHVHWCGSGEEDFVIEVRVTALSNEGLNELVDNGAAYLRVGATSRRLRASEVSDRVSRYRRLDSLYLN